MKNWDQIRYFLAAARHNSVSAAAKSLGVGHATVLRHIDELEASLRVKLFQRLQSGYRLSEAGARVLDDATSAVDPVVEQRILQALRSELTTTAVIVAQRLSTIELADRVVYLERGRVAGVGAHRQLLEIPGYRSLVEAYEEAAL